MGGEVARGIQLFRAAAWGLCIACHGLIAAEASAQPGSCELRVWGAGETLPGARIFWQGNFLGATDSQGIWRFEAADVGKPVEVRALGFESLQDTLRCLPAGGQRMDLTPSTILLGGATVLGTLLPMREKDSPIRIRIIDPKAMAAVHAQDLVESLGFTNGLRETVGCGVCGTNEIQLGGMEGPYTLVLLDGMPLLGGLASVYALDGLPLSMIQQVEVLHGPASARFGSQAVGGVIQVILAPIVSGQGSVLLRQDTHGRSLMSAQSAWGRPEAPWQVGWDAVRFLRRIDDNGDGMTDAPTLKRGVLTLRHQRADETHRIQFTSRWMAEERFGGELHFQERDRGTQNAYGERIDLRRAEGLLSRKPLSGQGWTWMGGVAAHQQRSTYGLTHFNAASLIANLDVFHSGWSWSPGHQLAGGLALLWDVYTDDTPAQSDMNVLVPAIFGEYSGQTPSTPNPRWSWIHGLRVEFPTDRAPIVAPRIHVKWSPSPVWDARWNVGRGFRRVHLFTEEHAALDGSREVVFAPEGLDPESSWSSHLSFTRTTGKGDWTAQMGVQFFSTLFTDRIYADYALQPNAIVYRNLDGVGWNRGVGTDVWWFHARGWQVNAGITALRSERFESAEAASLGGLLRGPGEPIEFVPGLTTVLTAGKQQGKWGWDLAAQRVGTMAVPYYDAENDDLSQPFVLIHASMQRRWECEKGMRGAHQLAIGVQNLTNTHQRNPLLGVENPFSEAFDASRIYGPIEQRRWFLEWSWAW
jgi:outer membrane receptor for ferrienterochelin and colicins